MSKAPLRILFSNPYGIGDVLFTTPLLSALKEQYPDAYVGYLVGSRTKEVIQENPYVDQIFVYDKSYLKSLKARKRWKEYLHLIRLLRKHKFNTLLDFSLTREYAALAQFLLNIPMRIGFNLKNRGTFLTHKISIEGFREKHVARHYFDLGQFLDIKFDSGNTLHTNLNFFLSKDGLSRAEHVLRENGLSADERLVFVIPGGGASWGKNAHYKQWPPEYF